MNSVSKTIKQFFIRSLPVFLNPGPRPNKIYPENPKPVVNLMPEALLIPEAALCISGDSKPPWGAWDSTMDCAFALVKVVRVA